MFFINRTEFLSFVGFNVLTLEHKAIWIVVFSALKIWETLRFISWVLPLLGYLPKFLSA